MRQCHWVHVTNGNPLQVLWEVLRLCLVVLQITFGMIDDHAGKQISCVRRAFALTLVVLLDGQGRLQLFRIQPFNEIEHCIRPRGSNDSILQRHTVR